MVLPVPFNISNALLLEVPSIYSEKIIRLMQLLVQPEQAPALQEEWQSVQKLLSTYFAFSIFLSFF